MLPDDGSPPSFCETSTSFVRGPRGAVPTPFHHTAIPSGMSSLKPLPKKLENALKNQPKYAPRPMSGKASVDSLVKGAGVRSEADRYSFERDLLNSALGIPSNPLPPSSGPEEQQLRQQEAKSDDLLTSMANRLTALENANRSLRREVVEKDKALLTLRRRNELLEEGDSAADQVRRLDAENQQLRGQIHEMEAFLADYGLIWVGAETQGDTTSAPNDTPMSSTAKQPPMSEGGPETRQGQARAGAGAGDNVVPWIDYDLVLRKVKELNGLLDSAGPQMVTSGKKARFEDQDNIRITLYANGIMVKSGPFRPFTEEPTTAFLRDITVSSG